MVVYYHRYPPMVLGRDQRPLMPLRPDPRLLAAAERLGAWADFLVIPANLPHLLGEPIEQASGRPLLNMIELTMVEVDRRKLRTVGVVGLGEPAVYLRPLHVHGRTAVILPEKERNSLDSAIVAVMEGRAGPEEQSIACAAAQSLRTKGVDGIILGCTEIPLLLGTDANAPDLINPIQLLAEAAVQRALDSTTVFDRETVVP